MTARLRNENGSVTTAVQNKINESFMERINSIDENIKLLWSKYHELNDGQNALKTSIAVVISNQKNDRWLTLSVGAVILGSVVKIWFF